jgi:hypothetical protein
MRTEASTIAVVLHGAETCGHHCLRPVTRPGPDAEPWRAPRTPFEVEIHLAEYSRLQGHARQRLATSCKLSSEAAAAVEFVGNAVATQRHTPCDVMGKALCGAAYCTPYAGTA